MDPACPLNRDPLHESLLPSLFHCHHSSHHLSCIPTTNPVNILTNYISHLLGICYVISNSHFELASSLKRTPWLPNVESWHREVVELDFPSSLADPEPVLFPRPPAASLRWAEVWIQTEKDNTQICWLCDLGQVSYLQRFTFISTMTVLFEAVLVCVCGYIYGYVLR